jgi:hypothetical protein
MWIFKIQLGLDLGLSAHPGSYYAVLRSTVVVHGFLDVETTAMQEVVIKVKTPYAFPIKNWS